MILLLNKHVTCNVLLKQRSPTHKRLGLPCGVLLPPYICCVLHILHPTQYFPLSVYY